jgi:hypothetical protein
MKQIFILLAGLAIIPLSCPAQNKPEKSKYDIHKHKYYVKKKFYFSPD